MLYEHPGAGRIGQHGYITKHGSPALDSALDGLYWGANVVWLPDRTETAAPFFAAIAGLAPQYDQAAYVTLTRSPDEVRAALQASA